MQNIKDDVSGLKALGQVRTNYPDNVDPGVIEVFPNKFQARDYQVTFSTLEFTSLCPVTGQPDFGRINITYVPDKYCIESKSLKIYLFSYRNEPSFMETLVNRILEDLVAACQPRRMNVIGDFSPRGGIGIEVKASFEAENNDI
jgi:7-cyano-7-deazaguanine reductase